MPDHPTPLHYVPEKIRQPIAEEGARGRRVVCFRTWPLAQQNAHVPGCGGTVVLSVRFPRMMILGRFVLSPGEWEIDVSGEAFREEADSEYLPLPAVATFDKSAAPVIIANFRPTFTMPADGVFAVRLRNHSRDTQRARASIAGVEVER